MATPTRKEVFAEFKRIFIAVDDDTCIHNRWMSDEEIACIMEQKNRGDSELLGLSFETLNRAIGQCCSFENNRYSFQESNVTLFYYKHRFKVHLRNRQQIKFYYVAKGTDIDSPPNTTSSEYWKRIFNTPTVQLSRTVETQPPSIVMQRPSASQPLASKRKRRSSMGPTNSKLKPNLSQFQLKLEELRFAWKNTYGTDQPFPTEYIHFADRSKAKLPPAQHELVVQPILPNQHNDNTQYKTYDSITEVKISKIEWRKFRAHSAFMVQLIKAVTYKQCKSVSLHSRHMTAAYAASHPQIASDNIQTCIALARYTLLHDIAYSVNYDTNWLSLESVANSSPSGTSIDNYVKELAILQCLVYRDKLSDKTVYVQTDGGHKGQEISMLTYYDPETDKIEQLFLGLGAVGGKASKDVAKGIKERLELIGRQGKQLGGCTVDSGAGTPESLAAACRDKNFYNECALTSSCGLHDVM